jgi:hypothetical protein
VVSSSRRGLLLGGAALLLAGCGARTVAEEDVAGPAPEGERPEAELLAGAIAVKEIAAAAHEDPALARIERAHVARLRGIVQSLSGGRPAVGTGGEDDPERAEERTIAVLQDLLPRLQDPELRRLVADMMVVDAQQLAALRLQAGGDPAPEAFLAPRTAG